MYLLIKIYKKRFLFYLMNGTSPIVQNSTINKISIKMKIFIKITKKEQEHKSIIIK